MNGAFPRTRLWLDRLASVVLITGATFFWHEMLEPARPNAAGLHGPSLHLMGALGLALLTLGLGALSVSFGRLILRLRTADGTELRRLVAAHLWTVAQVLAGAMLTLLYVFMRR